MKDRIEEGKLIHVVAGRNPRYNRMAGRGVQDVSFEHIRFTGEGLPGDSVITGMSDHAGVRGVDIRDLTISDRPVKDPVAGGIRIGPFVADVRIH